MSRLPVRFRFAAILVIVLVFVAAAAVRSRTADDAIATAADAGGNVEQNVASDAERTDDGERPPFFVPEQYFLTIPGGFLTGPAEGKPIDIALDYLNTNAGRFALTSADLANAKVTSIYRDEDTGITHIYLRQMVAGLEVVQGDINIHITKRGEVICAGGGFVPGLKALSDSGRLLRRPYLPADEAVRRAAVILGINTHSDPQVISETDEGEKLTIAAKGVSLDDIRAELQYVPTENGSAKLSWGLVIRTPDGHHWYDLGIDAETGELLSQADWVYRDSYTVVAMPSEHPNDGFMRTVTNPADLLASPFGWHDTNGVAGAEFTDTRGNNVDAHLDRNADDVADPGSRPDGGPGLDFNTPFDPTLTPLQNAVPAVTDLFYWNNILHDVHYQYGFTPAAGNFQLNNYGLGGLGNDAVQADAQDGSGTNNANFGSPADGSAPRMQMYEWTAATPDRDSDMDGGIIAHEYGHGVSTRLTGGPANPNALNNIQSGGMGEGWSDFYALMFTQRPTDTKLGSYGIGTYSLNQPPSGTGIRVYPYSFDKTINPIEFDSYGTSGTTTYGLARSTAVHRSGTVWNTTLWDMNWLLIDKYGFDSDLYTGWTGSGAGGAGNKLAMRLVMDAMKLQPANPSFVQARDAILAADTALTGGVNQCEIWRAFARRGLGEGAVSGASSSTALITVSSVVPASCGLVVSGSTPVVDSVVSTPPTSFVINFSDALTPASVTSSDLTVNGIPATSVVLSSGNLTATFSYGVSPVTAQGVQTISIAAGAVTRASDSDGVDPFSKTFRYDVSTLAVTSTVPSAGGAFTLPAPFTLDVNFNEPISAASVSVDDLVLSIGTVTSANAIDPDTARYTITGINTEMPINVSVDASKVTDSFGNPNSGFAGAYQSDIGTVAFPSALTAADPLGSMIYEGSYAAIVGLAGDTDNFTLDLDAGQKLGVVITPGVTSLRPSITVTGPGGTNVTNSAAAAGGLAQLRNIPITVAGTYTLSVGGADSTIGGYTISTTLNSDREAETDTGSSNDTLGTAQDLTPAFTALTTGASRASVRGTSEEIGVSEAEPNGTTATANAISSATFVPPNLYQLGIAGTISSGTDTDYVNIGQLQAGDVLSITESGSPSLRGTNTDTYVYLYRGGTGTAVISSDDDGPGTDSLIHRFTIVTADTYYVRAYRFGTTNTGSYQLGIFLQNTGTAPTTGGTFTTESEPNDSIAAANDASGAWRQVNYQFGVSGSITAGDTDIFAYQFTAGDIVALTVNADPSLSPQSALLNSAGTVLAAEDGTSSSAGPGGTSPLYGYVIPSTGTYYHRVQAQSGTGTYSADVYRSTTAVVPLLAPAKDLYSFALTSGQIVSVGLKNISVGGLDISILDSGGAVVATGVSGATNLDESISSYTAASTGTYYVQVAGGGNVVYRVLVAIGAAQDTEPNDSFAAAQPIGGTKGAAGYTADSDYYSFAVNTGQGILLITNTPGDGPGLPVNSLNPKLELYDPSGALVSSGVVLADGRNEQIAVTAAATGNYRVRVIAEDSLVPTAGEYFTSLTLFVPTAAGVSVSGRVTTPEGSGLRGATVTMTDEQGVSRVATTASFGYFRFDDVPTGQNYVVAVRSKRFNFEPRVISLVDAVEDLDFEPIE